MTRVSPREWEVLQAVAKPGGSRRRAAAELGISPYTVDKHLRSVYLRLGVNTAAQAIGILTHFSDLPHRGE